MIELPETYVLEKQIQRNLVGKKVVRVQANTYPHKFAWYFGDPQEYPAMLKGKEVTAADSTILFGWKCIFLSGLSAGFKSIKIKMRREKNGTGKIGFMPKLCNAYGEGRGFRNECRRQ